MFSWRASHRWGSWWRKARWLFLTGIIAVLPLWCARQLPLADLPEHAAVSAALAHWGDPSWRIQEYFSFDPTRTPYWLYDVVAAGIAYVVPDALIAHKILLSIVGLSLPWSAACWLKALGRDPRLGAFASVLFWTKALHYGLLPFVASLPVFFFASASYTLFLRRPRGRLRHGLGSFALGCVLTLLHVTTALAFLLTAFGSMLLYRSRRRPALFVRLLPLLCGGVLLFYALHSHGDISRAKVGFLSLRRLFAAVPEWSFDVWHRRDEKVFAALYWVGYLGVFVVGRSRRGGGLLLWWPLVSVALVFFGLPFELGPGLMLNVRLGPLLAVLLLPVLRLRRTIASRVALATVLLGASGQSLVAASAIRDAQATLGDFPKIIASVPLGSRIFFLPFDAIGSGSWRHIASAIRVERGGLSQFAFTQMPHWPLQDRVSPRKPMLFWDQRPCAFDPDTDGYAYDVLLVRGAFDPFQAAGETERHAAGEVFELAVSAPPYYLWRRFAPASPEAPKEAAHVAPLELAPAPCVRWNSP